MRVLDRAMPEALQRLHKPDGQLPPPLHLSQTPLANRDAVALKSEQGTGEDVRGDDGVLYGEVDPNPHRRRHDVRCVADS